MDSQRSIAGGLTSSPMMTTTTMGRRTEPRDRLRTFSCFLLCVALAALGCGGDNLLLPADGQPAQISILEGSDNQLATVGQPLTNPLAVKVTDPAGRPVVGIPLVFEAPAGGAVAPSDTVETDSSGVAQVTYTLSTTAGEQIVEARTTTSDAPLSVSFHAMAAPEQAERLVAVGGDSQSVQVLLTLPESLVVQAVDRFGNGVPGMEVVWEAEKGGDVTPATDTTGPDGRAATQRTLGADAGSYVTKASAGHLDGSPIAFTSTAVEPPHPGLVLTAQPSADASAGVPFERQPELQLRDPLGAPLAQAGVSVTVQIASGGGSLGGTTNAESDANGVVRFSDLSVRGDTGTRTLIFASNGFTSTTSAPVSVGPGAPDAERSSASVDDGNAGSKTTISVRLQDAFGNRVPGARSAITVNVDGANPTSGLAIDEGDDGNYSASYVPVHSGTDMITVLVGGDRIGGSPLQSQVSAGPTVASKSTAQITHTPVLFFNRFDIVVTARDAQGNPEIKGGDRAEFSIDGGPAQGLTDNGNGTYSVSFQIFSVTHTIAITLNGDPIQGSPFQTP
jgi:hypothetical protein